MKETIKALKQDSELIEEKIQTEIMKGRNLLEGFKRATMMTDPTVIDLEKQYQESVKSIFILKKAKKFILKSIKNLSRLEK